MALAFIHIHKTQFYALVVTLTKTLPPVLPFASLQILPQEGFVVVQFSAVFAIATFALQVKCADSHFSINSLLFIRLFSTLLPNRAVWPYTTHVPDRAVRPYTTLLPDTTVRPYTTLLPDTTVRPYTTLLPDTTVRPSSVHGLNQGTV